MSTLIYNDADADFSIVETKRLPFIGYGNQGAAQAQNLRDSGLREILTSMVNYVPWPHMMEYGCANGLSAC